ncbi:hypothetical protein P8452_40979 [Trifolium repens]|nr:hypothetical protein P8452_40979 [Trifolium repens]
MESTKFEIPFNLRPSFNLQIQAAKLRWSALFDSVDSTTGDWITEQMITINNLILVTFVLFYLVITYWLFYFTLELDLVETGYETLLLVRLLLETRVPSIRKSSVWLEVHWSKKILPAPFAHDLHMNYLIKAMMRSIFSRNLSRSFR